MEGRPQDGPGGNVFLTGVMFGWSVEIGGGGGGGGV